MLLTAIFLQAFCVQSAMADHKKPKAEKTKDHKTWYFVAAPLYYLGVHIPLHESGHALAIGLNPNYSLDNFQPYPHFGNGHFYFGSADAVCKSKEACADKTGLGVIFLAPYMTDMEIFAVSNWLLSTERINPTSVAGRALYFAGMVVPWWDFSFNAVWANDISDAAQIARNFEIPRWSVMAIGTSVSALGVWQLWSGYKRAFHSYKGNESGVVITPMHDSGKIGVSVGMRF